MMDSSELPLKSHRLVNVQNITLNDNDSTISWESAESHAITQTGINELVFILDLSGQPGKRGYIVIILLEQGDDALKTFDLLSLRADEIPDALHPHCITSLPEHLIATPRNHVDVIISTKSGVGLSLTFWTSVLQPLWALVEQHLGPPPPPPSSSTPTPASTNSTTPVAAAATAGEGGGRAGPSVLITRDAQSIREIARALAPQEHQQPASAPPSRTIILLSGDGGVVDLLNGGLADAPPLPSTLPARLSLTLLPLGTANALFHSLHRPVWDRHALAPAPAHAPSPLALGLVTLFTGTGAQLPVFRASFSPGSLLVHQPAPPAHPVPAGTSGSSSSSSSSHVEAGIGMSNALAPDGMLPVEHLYGAVVASYGFHASIVFESDTPAYRAHGDKRFGMVAQDLLRESHAYLAAVRARRPIPIEQRQQGEQQHGHQDQQQDEQHQGQQDQQEGEQHQGQQLDSLPTTSKDPLKHAYVLITPLSNLERAFTISPASTPLDGTLRLVHFGAIGGARTMDVMRAAYDGGKHVGMAWDDGEAVLYQEVEEVEVRTLEVDARWRKVCVDGTVVELPPGGRFSVRREERRILDVLVHPEVVGAAAARRPCLL